MSQKKAERLTLKEMMGVLLHPLMILILSPLTFGLGGSIGIIMSATTGSPIWFAIGLIAGQVIVTGSLVITDWINQSLLPAKQE